MGRTAAVTYEQVCAAVAALRATGTSPGAKAIRHKIGDVGSLGTIQMFLQRMLSEEGAQPATTRMLSPELQRAVFKFTDDEVARINGELEVELGNCKRDAADLAKDNEMQGERLAQLHALNDEHTALKAGLEGQIVRFLEEVATARKETSQARREAELARTDLAMAQLRLEGLAPLDRDLRQLRTDFEAQRQALVHAEQTAAVLAAQKADLELRLVELKRTPAGVLEADKDVGWKTTVNADRNENLENNGRALEGASASKQSHAGKRSSGASPSDGSSADEKQQPKLC